MRARFLIAVLAIGACLPAHAEPPNAPVAAETTGAEGETPPNAWQRIMSAVIGQRAQSTVPDRTQDDEVWSEEDGAPAEEGVAAPCKLCPHAPPARIVDPPVLTAPRN